MNRNLLVLVGLASALSLAFASGCGDSGSDSGGGPAGGNAPTGGSPPEGGGPPEGGSPPEGGGTPGPATCASYCSTITGACSGANQQWPNTAGCEEACAAFDAGTPGDTSMNTLECRAYHAGVAAGTEPEVHCIHAGPLGGGIDAGNGCGQSRCDAFCRIAQEICGADAGYPFDNEDDCRSDCADYVDDVDFTTNETSGDTLACRMYHLTAALGDPVVHCAHLAGSQCTN
jgi:hypothetical protein